MSTVTKEALIAAIYGQESSSGKADTSKANYAGAIGPMQIIPSTFDGLKNLGIIPKHYDITNPEHSKDAGEKLVGHLFDKYGGDANKVAAAYYAGEKAVRKDGSIANFKDKANPNAPDTHQYVRDINRRLGGVDTEVLPNAAPTAPPQRASVLSSWDEGYAPREPKAEKQVLDGATAPIQAAPPAAPVPTQASLLAAEEAALRGVEQKRLDTGFAEKVGEAFMHQTLTGAVLRNRVTRDFNKEHGPEPGFMLDPKELAGYSADEQDHIREANSTMQLANIKFEIEQRREALQTINSNGTATALAAGFFAGLPEGYLSGVGSARTLALMKAGSRTLAAEGRTGAALLSSTTENVGVNLAMVGVQEQFDPYVGSTDAAFAVGFGLFGTAMSTPHIFGKADRNAIVKTTEQMSDNAAQQVTELRQKALDTLGADATPEALQAEVRRLEANQIRQQVSAATGALPPERRLLPDDENLRTDVEAAVKDTNVSNAFDTISADATRPRFNDTMYLAAREEAAFSDPKWKESIKTLTDGELDYARARQLPAGVHITEAALEDVRMRPVVEAIEGLSKKFLGDSRVIVGTASNDPKASGEIISAGKVHFIGVNPRGGPTASVRTAVHEMGHAVFHQHAINIPTPLLARMQDAHREFLKALREGDIDEAVNKRFGLTSPSREATVEGMTKAKDYVGSFDEYTAEQFVKFIESKTAAGAGEAVGLTTKVINMIKDAVGAALDFFRTAKRRGLVDPDESFAEFFQGVLDGNLKNATKADEFLDPGLVLPATFDRSADLVNDPTAVKHGLSLMPVGTDQQKAEAAAVTALYKKAETMAPKVDEKRLSKLLDTSVFHGAQSTANVMLRSNNPVMRMIAAELLESPSGAGGRRSNASISKFMNERQYLGNTLNEFQGHYKVYRDSQGGSVVGDFWEGKQWEQFNRLVAEEMESRLSGRTPVDSPPAVKAAADKLEDAYERMRVAQTQAKTIGWAALPSSSKGYMPHRMSPEKIRNMTTAQAEALQSALRDQFIQIEGFDITFAENLSRKYIDRVQRRALGGFDAPAGVHQVGAADIVEDALQAMGLSQPEVVAMMGKYMKGAAGHTKKRLTLDLSAEYPLGDGQSFKLLDLFETDQFKLLRSQANRVSGEVALARHGVMGKSGLKLLRRAMEFGADGEKATAQEFEAFDQVAAEFMGDAFGTQSKWVDRALQANSLARLGGMGFTQFAEAINGIFHVGVAKTLDSVSSMGRLRSEIKALARGEQVENPIIGSIERFGGAEFGTDSYKTVFPFDNGSLQYQTYGQDTLNAADRLLRGGTYIQGKLSLWRSIHSAQQRGMSEQIVRKAADYIKNGGNDVALRDMGMSDELIARLRKDIDSIAQFDGKRLTNFDITKATDVAAAEEFTQAIHRGVSQIIQGTFIGETGAWAHSSTMRLMTQFRTFSLTSIEKQWARQVGNVGAAKTLGMMLGAMSLAAPIYMARTYLASVGRPDQEEYLEKQLSAAQIARATLNYVAMSGLAGDMLDATTAVTGIGKVTGGRTGVGSEFVGNVVAPAAGLADDVWRALQNTKEGTDPHDLLKTLPYNRHPLLIPAINALGD